MGNRHLRNGNQEYVRTIVPGSPEGVINTHNYQAMYYEDGSYAGINEIVFNFKPWLDWYLQNNRTTSSWWKRSICLLLVAMAIQMQLLVLLDAGGHSDGAADATSGASNYRG